MRKGWMKRWTASILALTMAFSDCGAIPVFAAENAMAAETSVSENNGESPQTVEEEETISDETQADQTQADQESVSENGMKDTDETADIAAIEDAEEELPALHIGQIKKGEALPGSKDSEFVYDLPISFEMSDSLILFTNYNINAISGEENGTLIWSILRGEKTMPEGSTSLVNAEDDWIGFEVVSDSPYFTMTENEEEESNYYKMIELTSELVEDWENSENYSYYIRAAYYLETGTDKEEAPYAIATVPFRSQDHADITQDDMLNEAPDDGLEEEESDIDKASEEVDSENTDVDEASKAVDSMNPEEDEATETADSENTEADLDTETFSTISENDIQSDSEEDSSRLILSETYITMHPGDDPVQVTATIVPEDIPMEISWSSSDKTVAAVDQNGEITAKAEGKAQITAACGDLMAVVSVEVVRADTDKLLDLSGDIWVAGFEKESNDFVYTGQKITQDIRVYYKDTLLQEKMDYTLTYKNNVNAAAWNSLKAPSVTITLKGQYSGSVTLYYTIKPANIEDTDIYNTSKDSADGSGTDENGAGNLQSSGYVQAVNYSNTLKIPSPELMFGKTKLKANKDFVCDYVTVPEGDEEFVPMPSDYKKGDSYEAGKVYNYIVNGTGNFTGSFKMRLVVLKDKTFNFSSAAVTLDQKQYEYHGEPLTKSDVAISSVKLNKTVLEARLYEYEVCAEEIAGAYVMVYPSEAGRNAGYCGYKKVNLKLTGDRKMQDAALGEKWQASILYSQKTVNEEGGLYQAKTGVLTFGTGAAKENLTEGEDYTVKYSNAKKAGKVTVTFTGKGRYKGSLKKQYQIMPNADTKNIRVIWGKNVGLEGTMRTVAYQKGGAAPEFILKDQDNNVLKNKTDYTVKLKNNKAPGETMSCEIAGKGNYKGYSNIVELKVTAGDIAKATISVPDKPYSTKAGAWKSKVTIKDVNGKQLAAGKDYSKEFEYAYEGMSSGENPREGSTVTVTVHGMGCYEGSVITGSYRIYKNSISKLKFAIDAQEYTGEEITLVPSWEQSWENDWEYDIHVYANASDMKKKKNEIWEECYEIIGYTNNIKVGTAKVVLRGVGDYGGTKTCSFKIQKKKYQINHVKKITLDKTSYSMRLAERKVNLKATIIPETDWEKIANPTIIWSTSNSNIATIEDYAADPDNPDDAVVAGENEIIKTIRVKKEGTVTITATAQDGNKKAQCKITIVDVPILVEAGSTIERKVGETYQLTVEWDEGQVPDPSKLKWESNNTDRITVNKDGLVTLKKVGAATITLRAGSSSYVQQCNIIAQGEEEEVLPEGRALIYEQQPGTTNDTKAINSLLRQWEWNAAAYDYMYIPAGVYRIDAVSDFGGIVLTDNQTLILSPGALLVAIPNSKANYQVIYAFGRKNITISGGQIIGERKSHKGSGGEWGHGINIQGCTNVKISDMDISQCWGDGIYIGFYDGEDKYSKGVTIENCNLHHNRRNNLSITDASNVTVKNSQFNYASGTDPQYGIDIEPNGGRTCSDVTISDCTFRGNAKGTIQILGQLDAHVKGVRIENCTGDKAPVEWSGFGGSVSGVTYKNNKWN